MRRKGLKLPKGHQWEAMSIPSRVGVESAWECACGAFFYVCVDQGETTTQFEAGEGPCGIRRKSRR